MADQRLAEYAEILVDRCLTIEPGHQVIVSGSPLAAPLLKEIARQIAHKDAYALMRISIDGGPMTPIEWSSDASLERIAELPPITVH